ncbi:MAG: M14 family zinc carboxypeptidase, partial [Bacteroidota bacterium]
MKPLKALILTFLCVSLNIAAQAQSSNSLTRVKITVPESKDERLQMISVLELDHFIELGGFIEVEINQHELRLLRQSRYHYEVLVDDVAAKLQEINEPYFEGRRNGTINMDGTPRAESRGAFEQPGDVVNNMIVTPSAFTVQSGSPNLGGYYTYAQMVTAIVNLYNTYSPLGLVDTFQIGKSVENRIIYAVKISDNAGTDESNEPEVFFQGIQHAREAIGGSSMIFLMQYLCERYAVDNRIKNLVDNREIYIIVCMNPDGWEYNRTNSPGGGGGWRKNRKNIGSSQFGVDLNRNWSVDWANCAGAVGGTSCGSGTIDTNNDTYWGSAAFSEPETQAVRNFIRSKHIVAANDQHSVGPYYSLPYGRPGLHTSDPLTTMQQNWYSAIPALMGKYNGMRAGNSVQALGYEVAGGVKDWMLKGDLGTGVNGGLKTNIMGMTGEGGYGTTGAATFWPPASAIITLCKGMTYQDLQLIYSAGSYVDIQDMTDVGVTATSGNFSFKIKRIGIDNQPVTVSLIPISNVATAGAPVVVSTASLPNYYDAYTGNISFTLPAGIANGDKIKFAWTVQTTGYTYSDTITKFYNPTQLLYDNMEGSLTTNWTNITESGTTLTSGFGYNYTGGNWVFTSGGYGGSGNALSESANGTDYTAQSIRILQYNSTFNLVSSTAAYLTFQTKHAAENFHDKLQVQVSTDNVTWVALNGKTTVREPGINEGTSINGQPALTGIEPDWKKEEFDLSAYNGTPALRLRFVFTSDQTSSFYTAEDEGFFIDELKVIKTSTCPTITVTNPGTLTGTASIAFSQTFTASGGASPYTFSTASTLPTGLTLSSAGVLSGTPTQTGTFPIIVKATDANTCFGNGATYSLVIGCPTITVTNPGTTTGTAATAFSQTFTRTGGVGAVTFSTVSTLPTGLTLSSAGVLSGTPTQTGTFPIVMKATDANACFGNGA